MMTKCKAPSIGDDHGTESEIAVNKFCSGVLRDKPVAECGARYCSSGGPCCEGSMCMPLRPEKASLLLGLANGIGMGSCLLSSM